MLMAKATIIQCQLPQNSEGANIHLQQTKLIFNIPYSLEVMTGHKNRVIHFFVRQKFEFMK